MGLGHPVILCLQKGSFQGSELPTCRSGPRGLQVPHKGAEAQAPGCRAHPTGTTGSLVLENVSPRG